MIEDLGTKTGTTVDGHKYKGEKHVITELAAEIKMGGCPDMFRYGTTVVIHGGPHTDGLLVSHGTL